VATGQSVEVQSNANGLFSVTNLAPGEYALSVSAEGFGSPVSKITVTGGPTQTANIVLPPTSANAAAPSLGDMGFSPSEAQGSVVDQARLDRRSHMLKIHQRLGLITLAPLVATLISSSGATFRTAA
jgi:hypothetical protein